MLQHVAAGGIHRRQPVDDVAPEQNRILKMAPVGQRELPLQREVADAEGQQNRVALHGFGTVPFDRGDALHRQLITAGELLASMELVVAPVSTRASNGAENPSR